MTDAERDGVPVREALERAARRAGTTLGADARARAGNRPARKALLAAAKEVLEELGYEPRAGADGMELANCPFHALAENYTELVCGMNLELMTGMLVGLRHPGLAAHLDAAPGRCCVRIRELPRRRENTGAAG